MLGILLGVWLVAALLVGGTGTLRDLPLPPPALALLLAIAMLAAGWLVPGLRTRRRALGPGPLVAVHLTRLVAGIYFLVLAQRGILPDEFARLAGWGDIAVGLAAFPILMYAVPARTSGQRLALLLWNTAGLFDILAVLGNGLRLFRRDPAIAEPFLQLPLALLPILIVPLVIATHLWIFAWSTPADLQPLSSGPVVPPGEPDESGVEK